MLQVLAPTYQFPSSTSFYAAAPPQTQTYFNNGLFPAQSLTAAQQIAIVPAPATGAVTDSFTTIPPTCIPDLNLVPVAQPESISGFNSSVYYSPVIDPIAQPPGTVYMVQPNNSGDIRHNVATISSGSVIGSSSASNNVRHDSGVTGGFNDLQLEPPNVISPALSHYQHSAPCCNYSQPTLSNYYSTAAVGPNCCYADYIPYYGAYPAAVHIATARPACSQFCCNNCNCKAEVKLNTKSMCQTSSIVPKPPLKCPPQPSVSVAEKPLKRTGYLNNILYKTELCIDYSTHGGFCPRGIYCQYAHGDEEMHSPQNHPLYKTAYCYDFQMTGYCPRRERCFHVHESEEMREKDLQKAKIELVIANKLLMDKKKMLVDNKPSEYGFAAKFSEN